MTKEYEQVERLIELSGFYSTVREIDGIADVVCASERGQGYLSGNSCKIYFWNDRWFLETWAPVRYQFPCDSAVEAVVEACAAFLRTPRLPNLPYPFTTVGDTIVRQYGLVISEMDDDSDE